MRSPLFSLDRLGLFFLIVFIPIGELVFSRTILFSPEITNYPCLQGNGLVVLVALSKLTCLLSVVLLLCIWYADPGYLAEDDPECEVAQHCHVCDNTVVDFDHHCGVLGTCIGSGNMKYFILFLNTVSILCLNVCVCSLLCFYLSCVASSAGGVLGAVNTLEKIKTIALKNVFSIVFTIIGIYASLFCGFLAIFYDVMAFRGTFSYKRRKYPHLRGHCGIVFRRLFTLRRNSSREALLH
ncbi:DHHC palmitoyltransferase, putative [Angomonas deanei]|uniref:Palmitoyltransferase n=1 Tax=Angomonas deanei TaxID=59799 RepID=A0A7G2C4W7_9TRYP|nr:DHHC palmitoyltransferase, putative [Angomonas deanei]